MNKVTQIISNQMHVNIKSINITSNDGIFEGLITLKVHNVSFLLNLQLNSKKSKLFLQLQELINIVDFNRLKSYKFVKKIQA